MSRPMVSVSIQLPDEKIATGQGRDLLITAARAYRQAVGPSAGPVRVKLVERLGRGHSSPDEHRFEGTFHVLVTDADGTQRTLEVQARSAK